MRQENKNNFPRKQRRSPLPQHYPVRLTAQQMAQRKLLRRRRYARRRLITGLLLFGVLFLGLALALRSCGQVQEPNTRPSINMEADPFVTSYVQPKQGRYTVAMDAGHGGDDIGATGLVGEVALTERTVYYLNGWLKNDANYNPIYCRPDGEGASIAQRTQTATDAGAHLLISIHGNSSDSTEVSGFECFPVPPGRNLFAPSLRFAQLLSTKMQQAGQTLRGEAGVRYVYYANDGTGAFPKYLVEESDVRVRTDQSFGVLESATCPAVLVEQCFLTSEIDVAAWATEEGFARAARAYYEAICAYFNTQPLPQTA